MPNPNNPLLIFFFFFFFNFIHTIVFITSISIALVDARTLILGSKHNSTSLLEDSLVYLWPFPAEYAFGNETLSVHPDLSLAVALNGENSSFVTDAFHRCRAIIFKHDPSNFKPTKSHICKLRVVVHSDNEEVNQIAQSSFR